MKCGKGKDAFPLVHCPVAYPAGRHFQLNDKPGRGLSSLSPAFWPAIHFSRQTGVSANKPKNTG
ncbi:hypothetical protein X474_03940 [Dethiosulfatarculus sandiegensis]|uniref:Uncharacterized protein n=1 Tax=Dethiosulfatarculus sandiegensis TaxID=1429043 RepID=A0A0D2K189_9BACT|nr:hypothetical protein X474_03940 [Dethiosulfatarculus sandiegensis]